MPHKSADVDVGEDWNLVALQIFVSHLVRTPVGGNAREFAHDQSLDIRLVGLIVFGVGTVISYLWIGENDDLTAIGRVGRDFLIAGDGGVKNYFARTFARGSVAFAAEDPSIFQSKNR